MHVKIGSLRHKAYREHKRGVLENNLDYLVLSGTVPGMLNFPYAGTADFAKSLVAIHEDVFVHFFLTCCSAELAQKSTGSPTLFLSKAHCNIPFQLFDACIFNFR